MNENSISPNSNGEDGSEKNRIETFQVSISDLLNDLDTLRVRIEHLENALAKEISINQSKATGHFTVRKIITSVELKLKKWIRNRRKDSAAPQ